MKRSAELDSCINLIREQLGHSGDLILREFTFGSSGGLRRACLAFIDGLSDCNSINDYLMRALQEEDYHTEHHDHAVGPALMERLKNATLPVNNVALLNDPELWCDHLAGGFVVLLVDGEEHALLFCMAGWENRGVPETTAESVVRGSKEAFSESLIINTSLIRRRIKDPNLWITIKPMGRVTKTNVAVVYIKGIADEGIVEEVKTRLSQIDIDGILESNTIEELIQDKPYSPFPTIYNTERPDTIAAGLLEGRVAIIVEGTPFVLLVPAIFVQFFQSAEDYYQGYYFSSLIRIMRFVSFFIALLGPSLYVGITTYHQEMLPTSLLISLASQREGVPFPAFIEAVMMEMTLEILREAGLRMPRAIGQAISIVGTLVIGQSAVTAGIVSAGMVIVVSITAISSFMFPSYSMSISIRMIRFLFIGLAATFGLYGILIGLILLVMHLVSLRSFGVPYMGPFAPLTIADQGDAILRLPAWNLFKRPTYLGTKNTIRSDTTKPVSLQARQGKEGN
ncbi:spore germination protein [Paenibacillus sp. strain BS8-2]